VDVEVRDIWQPWLRSRCNFAVRYIVPDRKNILRILGAKGQFTGKVVMREDTGAGTTHVEQQLIFRPRLLSRLVGRKAAVMSRPLPASVLAGSRYRKGTKRSTPVSVPATPSTKAEVKRGEVAGKKHKKHKKKENGVDVAPASASASAPVAAAQAAKARVEAVGARLIEKACAAQDNVRVRVAALRAKV